MPEWLQRQHLRRQLVPGAVIKLNVKFSDGSEKEKRLVVVQVTEDAVCFVVNSEVNPLLARNPGTKRAQVDMPVADHPFMSRDSRVNCSEIHRFPIDGVVADLLVSKGWMLGNISTSVRDEIIVAIRISSTIAPNVGAPLIASLETIGRA